MLANPAAYRINLRQRHFGYFKYAYACMTQKVGVDFRPINFRLFAFALSFGLVF
jgi:hypothetical protein